LRKIKTWTTNKEEQNGTTQFLLSSRHPSVYLTVRYSVVTFFSQYSSIPY